MKAIKLVALTSAAALLAACGTGGNGDTTGGWEEVDRETFIAGVTAVEDYQYLHAHVTGAYTATRALSGEGEDWDTVKDIIMSGNSMTSLVESETDDIDVALTYGEEGWEFDDPEDASELEQEAGQEVLFQLNKAEYFEGLIPEEASEDETEETEQEIVTTVKLYSGKGWKVTLDAGDVQHLELVLDQKAWIVSESTTYSYAFTQDMSTYGYDAVVTMATTVEMNMAVAYSGEYVAPAAEGLA